jgi:pyridoxal phosphate enzyme (YggS family)
MYQIPVVKSLEKNIKSFLSTVPKGVKLIAVSKTKPIEQILEVYNTGQRIFGENRVQELISKHDQLPKDIEWHLIGHLQSNKVKYVVPFVSMIHSVDSLKLLITINQEALKAGKIINLLFQMYIAREETKFGLDFEELCGILSSPEFKNMANVKVRGLMGIATYTDDNEQIRSEFRQLKEIFEKCRHDFFAEADYFSELSMGMSGDYKIAIEEGATMIRIGSTLFGERNYL